MSLDNELWFAYIAVEAALVGLLLYRRVWRTLPVFFSYCIWDIFSNIAVYLVSQHYAAQYFQVYFAETVLDSSLLFCVLLELAWSVLRPVRASLSRSALLVVAALILLAGAAIWPFAALPGLVHATSKQGLLFAQLQQTLSILRILFFLLLAAGSQFLSISWRDRELQVATGLGFVSFIGVAVALLQMHQTTVSKYQHLSQLVIASYLCCVFYWLVSFAQKEAERREFTPQMQNFLLAVAGAAHSTRVALTASRENKARKQHDR